MLALGIVKSAQCWRKIYEFVPKKFHNFLAFDQQYKCKIANFIQKISVFKNTESNISHIDGNFLEKCRQSWKIDQHIQLSKEKAFTSTPLNEMNFYKFLGLQ